MVSLKEALRETIAVPQGHFQVSADELLLGLQALRLEHAQRNECAVGAPLAIDQEVVIDAWLVSGLNPVPRSVQAKRALVLTLSQTDQGFLMNLVGRPSGTEQRFSLTLNANFALSELRGATVTQVVKVLAARTLTVPSEQDPEFWKATGLGSSFAEVLAGVRHRLEGTRLRQLAEASLEVVLMTLATRLGLEPTPDALTTKKLELFETTELPSWAALGLSAGELSRVRASWNASPSVNRWAIRALVNQAVLGELKAAGLVAEASMAAAAQVLRLPCVTYVAERK